MPGTSLANPTDSHHRSLRLANKQLRIVQELNQLEKTFLRLQSLIHTTHAPPTNPNHQPSSPAAIPKVDPTKLQSKLIEQSKRKEEGEKESADLITDEFLPLFPAWGPSVWQEPEKEINAVIDRLGKLATKVGFTKSNQINQLFNDFFDSSLVVHIPPLCVIH